MIGRMTRSKSGALESISVAGQALGGVQSIRLTQLKIAMIGTGYFKTIPPSVGGVVVGSET